MPSRFLELLLEGDESQQNSPRDGNVWYVCGSWEQFHEFYEGKMYCILECSRCPIET
jgi:hypothetical protein